MYMFYMTELSMCSSDAALCQTVYCWV